MEHPAENVPSQLIRPQKVAGGRRFQLQGNIGFAGIIWGEQAGEDGNQEDEDPQDQSSHGQPVLLEISPKDFRLLFFHYVIRRGFTALNPPCFYPTLYLGLGYALCAMRSSN
jgi:hypothetical protein